MKIAGWIIIAFWLTQIATIGPMSWPSRIASNPTYGAGYIVGNLLILAIGILFVIWKRKKASKSQ